MDWDLYNRSLTVDGETRRERVVAQTQRNIIQRTKNNPSFKHVLVDGEPQDLVITSSTEMWHKKLDSMPNERIYMGSIVEWNGRHFIIFQTDADYEVVQRGEMYECNLYLKWQNEKGEIVGRYGWSENLSQFSSGTVESRIMMSIQQVFHVLLPLDEETVKLRRDKRFLIDVLNQDPMAYVLTRRDVVSNNYTVQDASEGIDYKDKLLSLALSETQLSERDNVELMIADYFEPETDVPAPNDCKIRYKGEPKIRVGGTGKQFTVEFYDPSGNVIEDEAVWSLVTTQEDEGKFTLTTDGSNAVLSVKNDTNLLGTQVKLMVANESDTCSDSLFVKVVSVFG